jgi:hypothetical protein
MEVVPPAVIPIEESTRLSSGVGGLSLAASEALGVSLSKVCDLYFGDRDKVERDCIVEEERDCHQEDCRFEEE